MTADSYVVYCLASGTLKAINICIYMGGEEWKYRFTARHGDSPAGYLCLFTDLEGSELLQL